MFKENYINKCIEEVVMADNEVERLKHISSGKLSASRLGEPLQWQVLNALGIGVPVYDSYTLKKFLRGRHVEEWYVGKVPGVTETQFKVEYRDVVGIVDALVDSKDYDLKAGIMPHEVKSVARAKFKRLKMAGDADISHKLQAGLYALALGSEYYAIDYVVADDYDSETWIYKTSEIKPAIDQIITEFQGQMAKKKVPVFSAKLKWQEDPKYNKYPEWTALTQDQIDLVIKTHYPKVWSKK